MDKRPTIHPAREPGGQAADRRYRRVLRRSWRPSVGMRHAAALALVLAAVLLTAPRAAAYDRPALLEKVAATFALRSADVRCPTTEEWVDDPIWGTGPGVSRAWGYTEMIHEYIVMHPALCAGAMAVSDPGLPLWQRAVGTLVLVHEAYHLRHWASRRSEAKVECQAIRHFTVGAQLLGASPELANELLPFALAAHQRMVTLFREYRDPGCMLPLWRLPMTP